MNDVTGMPQSAVVLGGTSEIALATVRELAGRRLSRVVLIGRDASRLESGAAELRRLGVAQTTVLLGDLAHADSVEALADASAQAIGEIDLVLLASGELGTAELDELTPQSVAASIATNFAGPAAAALAFARLLARQGHGRILVLSSVAGYRVRRQNFVYGAGKAGLDGFSQGLSDALAGSGVEIVIVRPGFVRTRMTAGRKEVPFAVGPDAVARSIVEGLEAGRAIIWVPGVLRIVFPVLRALPRALWRKMPA